MKKYEPIHCVEVDKAKKLIGKRILCAQHKECLGFYGELIGINPDNGKFWVLRDCDKRATQCQWIVEDQTQEVRAV